jgi:hypothetical protein
MISDEMRRALDVWRAVYLLARAHHLFDPVTMTELVMLGRRLRALVREVDREGTQGRSASSARATLNRMGRLLDQLHRRLSTALRL